MLEPFFLDSAGGRILCTAYRAGGPPGPGLLLLPPFAEEMNKSRHVIARLGHRLAAEGWTTVLPDLIGTGDSEGDFADATWERWRANAIDALRWLSEAGCRPLFVGGLRLGAGLALDVLPDLPAAPRSLLLWQPVASGRTALTQFLRLRVAGGLGADGARETTTTLRERLGSGETVEVAGYTLAPELAAALDLFDASACAPPASVDVDWFEVSVDAAGCTLPAAQRLAESWRRAGTEVEPRAVGGDPFWATQELASAPRLIECSIESLRGRAA